VLVEFGELAKVEVTETLVPEHAESRPTESIDKESLCKWGGIVTEFGEDGGDGRSGRVGDRGGEVGRKRSSDRDSQ
jgi:hypothetical protein